VAEISSRKVKWGEQKKKEIERKVRERGKLESRKQYES
jgi:hypothetical protein